VSAFDAAYDCECCGLPLCRAKLAGIGYYCGRCERHFGWFEELGRPGSWFDRLADCLEVVETEHARMAALFATIRGWS
jgi:hypothetical protein